MILGSLHLVDLTKNTYLISSDRIDQTARHSPAGQHKECEQNEKTFFQLQNSLRWWAPNVRPRAYGIIRAVPISSATPRMSVNLTYFKAVKNDWTYDFISTDPLSGKFCKIFGELLLIMFSSISVKNFCHQTVLDDFLNRNIFGGLFYSRNLNRLYRRSDQIN